MCDAGTSVSQLFTIVCLSASMDLHVLAEGLFLWEGYGDKSIKGFVNIDTILEMLEKQEDYALVKAGSRKRNLTVKESL